jgi:signal transduction histidine kinase
MYKNIRLKLTLLFAGIAGLILAFMSLFYLYMSEKELKSNQFLSFCTEANTIILNLEQQNTISYEWIAKAIVNERCTIAIYDKNIPLTYTTSILSEKQQKLAAEFLNNCFPSDISGSEFISPHSEIQYKASDGRDYYVSVASLHSGNVHVVIYSSAESLNTQIKDQRVRFSLANVLGILSLFLFSYFYTGKLLAPIGDSQKRQNDFIAAASHELRTPLAVILSSVSAMKEAEEEERMTFLHTIAKESDRMSILVGDMLTLAGADNQTWSFHMKDTELDTLLLDSYEAFLPLAGKKEISLRITLPDEPIPTCRCDSARISQLLAVLISNAIAYGSIGGTVWLSLTYDAPRFLLTVADNGPGIPAEAREHIFERFYRGENSRSAKEHFGLGLSIAKEIADAHHGMLTLAEREGGGCVFTLRLSEVNTRIE